MHTRKLPFLVGLLILSASAAIAQEPAKAVINGREQVAVGASVVLDSTGSIGEKKWLLPETSDFDIYVCGDGGQLSFSCPSPRVLQFVLATAVAHEGTVSIDIARFSVIVGDIVPGPGPVNPPTDPPETEPEPGPDPPAPVNPPNIAPAELAQLKDQTTQATRIVNNPKAARDLADAWQADLAKLADPDMTVKNGMSLLNRTRYEVLATQEDTSSNWYDWRVHVDRFIKGLNITTTSDLALVYEAIIAGLRAGAALDRQADARANDAKSQASIPPPETIQPLMMPPNPVISYGAPQQQPRYRRVCDGMGNCYLVPY